MDARRGYVPEDDMNFSPGSIGLLQKASGHIRYLLNEGYELKQASTFVGNHFLLSERQRLAIARSIASDQCLKERRQNRVTKEELSGQTVWIDGFNTIITLEVMKCRSLLFECMDGAIRDLAALRGTYRIIPETKEAVRSMFDVLQDAQIREAKILLDQPVSNSGRLKTLIAETGEEYPFALDIQILRSVDRELYGKENVITSDSVILDHCVSWFNLTAECLDGTGFSMLRVWKE